MDKQKHTPGPWTFVPVTDDKNIPEQFLIGGVDRVVAKTLRGYAVDEANARIIASSPKLLKALKELWDEAQNALVALEDMQYEELVRRLQEKLSKAEEAFEEAERRVYANP